MADNLMTGLRKQSKNWATAITREATKNLGKFAKLIKVSSQTVENNGKISIVTTGKNVVSDEYGDIKKVARAYEYGSGLRARRKSRKAYDIKPRRKKFLAFYWEKAIANPGNSTFVGLDKKIYIGGEDDIPTDARILVKGVKHPGVRAANNGKGYIQPARTKILRTLVSKEVPKEVKKTVIGVFRSAFK